jgi:hypothetical protein
MKFPRFAYNPISIVGALIAVTATIVVLLLFVLSPLGVGHNPYIGIIHFLVLPGFLWLGLVLIPIGMYRQWRAWKRGSRVVAPEWPQIDLNQARQRNAFFVFVFGTIVFVLLGLVGAYQGYEFTETVGFCGTTCHRVMKPEHTAYQNSPHARVRCTACHVGPGAGWYVKSKLSGAYQVYAVLADVYPRPIPTPVRNLRPAQETCEQCHWPEKFFGSQQRQFNNYMYDDENTHWPVNLLVKIGGGDPKTGQTAGIHWHMNIGVRVEYIARDEARQDIPWVRVTDRTTGRVTVYQDSESPMSEEEIASASPRLMDCMDCHNRPSHNYRPPDHAINTAILTQKIDRGLPAIKRIAVEAMAAEYETEEGALVGIANAITEFYSKEYPDVYRSRRTDVDAAILAAQEAYSQNIFPEMGVRWSKYPDNIGHLIYPGCMRCHGGRHRSDEGVAITSDCRACHTILSQGTGDRAQVATGPEGLDFVHPEEIDDAWREMGCFECHDGTQP